VPLARGGSVHIVACGEATEDLVEDFAAALG
jgi:hypothetical protein